MAILLDSFLEEDEEEEDPEIVDMKRKAKMAKRLAKQKRKEANKIFMGDRSKSEVNKGGQASNFYFGEKKSSGEEDLEDLDEDQIVKIFKE